MADASRPPTAPGLRSVFRPGFFAGQAAWVTGGGVPLVNPLFPGAEHAASLPYDGFHRAVTPEVLKEGPGDAGAAVPAGSPFTRRAL
jgi:hypothetical protein